MFSYNFVISHDLMFDKAHTLLNTDEYKVLATLKHIFVFPETSLVTFFEENFLLPGSSLSGE